jgi:putative ABC transport system substrate-binding protein
MSLARREFIRLLGGAAAAWPIAARAQFDGRVRRIGVLLNFVPDDPTVKSRIAAFEQVLRTRGWKIGQYLQIDYRWGSLDPERVAIYARELVALAPDLIVANTTVCLTAVLKATRTIPIVFMNVSDPVVQGFVSDLAHPDGNATGFVAYEFSIAGKWADLLKQFNPAIAHVGLMFNPTTSPQSKFFLSAIESAAPSLGVDVTAMPVHAQADIGPAIEGLARRPNSGFVVGSDNFVLTQDQTVIQHAARFRLPAVYSNPEFVKAGGLMSYAEDMVEPYRGAGYYVDRILKGAKPGDLPIQLPTKFALSINLKAVEALGIDLPMGLMLSANEVIE